MTPRRALQIVGNCGCIWEHQPGWEGWWRLQARCARPYTRHHEQLAFESRDLKKPSVEVAAVGYAIAASQGVGPWAKHFPRSQERPHV